MSRFASCPACGPELPPDWVLLARRARFGEDAPTFVCRRCGLAATHTSPSEPGLAAAYRTRVFADHETTALDPDAGPEANEQDPGWLSQALHRRLSDLALALDLASTSTRSSPLPRLLHVGSREGTWLTEAQRHFDLEVQGVEPFTPWVQTARRAGVTTHCEPLETLAPATGDAAPSSGLFDVVVEHHLLEHLPDPVAHLEAIRRQLRPTGIAVVEVPNLLEPMAPLEERFLQACHRFAFTPRALALVCLRAGLVPIRVVGEADLRVFCRAGTPEPAPLARVAGPDGMLVAHTVLCTDLCWTLRQGFAQKGLDPLLVAEAVRAHHACPSRGGRADIAIEVASAHERAGSYDEAARWLRQSLSDRSDPEVQRALAKVDLLRGRPREAWLSCTRSEQSGVHPDHQTIHAKLRPFAQTLPC